MFNAIRHAARSSAVLRTVPAARPNILRTAPFVRTLITKRYTEEHEAVIFDDATGLATVAITDYAQQSLGDVVFVELPVVGTKVAQHDQIGAVESVKAASDVYAPVSGTVEQINEVLSDSPSLLNKSPEGDGWLCKIKVSDSSELDSLLTEAAYKEHCSEDH